jgi:hypothetical protein
VTVIEGFGRSDRRIDVRRRADGQHRIRSTRNAIGVAQSPLSDSLRDRRRPCLRHRVIEI